MNNKTIVKHKMTYTTPLRVIKYSDTESLYPDSFNYRIHKNFWSSTHPMESAYNKLQMFVPHSGECEDGQVEAFRLIANIYYDTYNKMCNFFCKANDTQTSFFA